MHFAMADPVLQFLTDFLKVNFSGMCMKLQRLSDWKKKSGILENSGFFRNDFLGAACQWVML